MYALLILFHLLEAVVIINLIFPVFLWIIQLFASKKNYNQISNSSVEPDYAIIVTAYQQVTLIPEVVKSILNINYTNYIIYIVADNCDISSLVFEDNKVVVLRPEEVLASNVKSHFYAINNFKRPHERLTIIDSDNLVDANYLLEMNKVFALGYQAVQGVRAAKNLNTNEWYILSSVNKMLIVADADWNVKNVYALNPAQFHQPEGIAFDNQFNLYISNEGDLVSPGNVLKFNYIK